MNEASLPTKGSTAEKQRRGDESPASNAKAQERWAGRVLGAVKSRGRDKEMELLPLARIQCNNLYVFV